MKYALLHESFLTALSYRSIIALTLEVLAHERLLVSSSWHLFGFTVQRLSEMNQMSCMLKGLLSFSMMVTEML